MVNKFYYIKGGSETYYFALKRLLEKHGHKVIDFSMVDPRNYESPYSKYFVDNVDYENACSITNKTRMAINIIYSFEAKKKFESLVLAEKPDIVHLHIFQHQISTSILDVIKKYNIPTVYTAHDLKMVCPNYKMMHHGKICEKCKGGKYYHCAINKCVKNSFIKSCINVVEGYLHKWRHSYSVIDQIITPSLFYYRKFKEFGIDPERMVHIPNFLDTDKPVVSCREDKEKYYLYFGRLSEEKGVFTLLKAFSGLLENLYIVGTGPIQEEILQYITNHKLRNIYLLGYMSGQELKDIVGNAKAVILPSEWYENGPYSAIEALQLGIPIIGANIGGIPELIDGNGFLFQSGVAESLAIQILKVEKMPDQQYKYLKLMSSRLYQNNYTAENYYKKIEKIYEKARKGKCK